MRMNEYPQVTNFDEGDIILKDGPEGTAAIPFKDAAKSMLEAIMAPEMHRNYYRGKFLGTSVTQAQKDAIEDGSFKDLYTGDYWTINGRNWVIADFDYFWNNGYNPKTTVHHLMIVPEDVLYETYMDGDCSTSNGYLNSDMRKTGLNEAKSIITEAFGDMVLSHQDIFVNASRNGRPTGTAWAMSTVELFSEVMVYGCNRLAVMNDGVNIPANYTTDKKQVALFKLNPKFADKNAYWWLRDVVSDGDFAYVNYGGLAYSVIADTDNSVLPYFIIG